ncbi:LOW QUALITY PROTEIN: Methyltransf_16 domain-containing protein, partial [Cephalotus follicularis]
MEPTDSLISLARVCSGGAVTETVQRFIWDHCINKAVNHASRVKNFLKKLIVEVESKHGDVLDELYAYAYYMASFKDDDLVKGNARVCKYISFLFPDACFDLRTCPKSQKLGVPLECSLNKVEGDTGCSIWPSSLFLSEFILSFPDIFSGKSCFELGSGVGLARLCLAHAKASKVCTSDVEFEILKPEKNLLMWLLSLAISFTCPQNASINSLNFQVQCFHLPWESASESELLDFMPDIILGAYVIYDPLCLPHLVRVLAIFFNKVNSCSQIREENIHNSLAYNECVDGKVNGADRGNILRDFMDACGDKAVCNSAPNIKRMERPVAYIAFVIRNAGTFNYFLVQADQANLTITDATETLRP